MNDSLDELGRSINQAVRFLRQIHEDVAQLLTTLDGLMAARGWEPTENNRISYDLSNSLGPPTRWVLDCAYRWYVPQGLFAGFQQLIAFIIRLSPPEPIDQPVVLATAAKFPARTDYNSVLQRWESSDPVLKALGAGAAPRLLSEDDVKSFLPAASRVAGLTVELCRLSGTEALLSLCVEPILASFADLPP